MTRAMDPNLVSGNQREVATLTMRHAGWAVHDRVGVITLDRPERKNPLTFEMYAELRDLFRALAHTGDVRAVVLQGAGGHFCSGGDVHEIIGPLTKMRMPDLLTFTRMTGDLVLAMRACPQPILAAIDGVCAGAGAIIAMASDLRVGTRRSQVAFLFSRVGLGGCDMGACSLLPRIVGQGRAAELLFTGRAMSGDEALSWGFYNRLADADAVGPTTASWAAELAAGPTFGHAMTKRMLHHEWALTVEQAIEAEAQAQAICMMTEDFQRAYLAFGEKKKPVFEGD